MPAHPGKMEMAQFGGEPPASRNDSSAPPKFKLILKSGWIAPSPTAAPAPGRLRKAPRNTMTRQDFPYKKISPGSAGLQRAGKFCWACATLGRAGRKLP